MASTSLSESSSPRSCIVSRSSWASMKPFPSMSNTLKAVLMSSSWVRFLSPGGLSWRDWERVIIVRNSLKQTVPLPGSSNKLQDNSWKFKRYHDKRFIDKTFTNKMFDARNIPDETLDSGLGVGVMNVSLWMFRRQPFVVKRFVSERFVVEPTQRKLNLVLLTRFKFILSIYNTSGIRDAYLLWGNVKLKYMWWIFNMR